MKQAFAHTHPLMLASAWLTALLGTLGGAYLALIQEVDLARAAWLPDALRLLQVALLLGTLALPWLYSRVPLPTLRYHPLLYGLLLAGFWLLALYTGPYMWLLPLALTAMAGCIALLLLLLGQLPRHSGGRLALLSLGYMLMGYLLRRQFLDAADNFYSSAWLREGSLAPLGGLLLAFLLLPMLAALPPLRQQWRSLIGQVAQFPPLLLLLLALLALGAALVVDALLPQTLLLLLSAGSACLGGLAWAEASPTLWRQESSALAQGLLLLLLGIIFVAIPFATQYDFLPFLGIWYVGGIALAPLDGLLLLAGLVTGALLLVDLAFRQQLRSLARDILWAYGGLWWALLLLWIGVGVPFAVEVGTAALVFLYWLAGLLGALLSAWFVTQGQGRNMLRWVGGTALLQAGIALLQFVNERPLGLTWLGERQFSEADLFIRAHEIYRAYGLTRHPLRLSVFLMVALFMVLLLLYRYSQRRRDFWLHLLLAAGIGVGILVTNSRVPLVATLGVLGLVVLGLGLPRGLASPRMALLAGGLLLLIGLLSFFAFGEAIMNRFERLNPASIEERLLYGFEGTDRVIREYPITGTGISNTSPAYERYFGENQPIPHNVFLLAWVETGLIGAGLLLLGSLHVVWQMRPRYGPGAYILAASFLGLMLSALTNSGIWFPIPYPLLLFTLLGFFWGYRAQPAPPNTATEQGN